jgi:hypothetical protein
LLSHPKSEVKTHELKFIQRIGKQNPHAIGNNKPYRKQNQDRTNIFPPIRSGVVTLRFVHEMRLPAWGDLSG